MIFSAVDAGSTVRSEGDFRFFELIV